jgi:hypothetical protein
MTKREYLRSLGFTVGERGRFNTAMQNALSKYDGVFEDDQQKTKLENISVKRSTLKPQTVQREARSLYGYTREGYKVGFINCASCKQHMIWCECDKVTAPSIVVRSDDKLVKIA